MGYLGVDLFFVISGLLIGGILINQLKTGKKINYFKFILQRGFKIWPSYYFFLAAGSLLAYIFYRNTNPDQIIPLNDLKRYLFFYQNYTGVPFHWSFDHVWSLCVEEHFYILLPLLLLLIQMAAPNKYQVKILFIAIVLTIIAGILFKFASFYFTKSKDTTSGTQNRIDALAWGVLLSYLINFHSWLFQSLKIKITAAITGIVFFVATLCFNSYSGSIFFTKLIFHSLVPFCFFLIIIGLYTANFKRFTLLRFIAYYSYNWYLWHVIFVIIFVRYTGATIWGLCIFLPFTFLIACLATILVEEPILGKRKNVLNKMFKKNERHLLPIVTNAKSELPY